MESPSDDAPLDRATRYHHFHLVSCGGKLFKVEDGPHMKEETSISVWRLEQSKMEWFEVAPIPPLEKGTWLWYIGCVAGKDNQCMIYMYEVNYPNLMSVRCCVCDLKTARGAVAVGDRHAIHDLRAPSSVVTRSRD